MNVHRAIAKRLKKSKDFALRAASVRSNVEFGRNFHVGPGSVIWAPTRLAIGNNVYIGKHVTIEVDGTIGDEVLIANGSGLVGRMDHDYTQIDKPIRSASWVGDSPEQSRPINIGSDVWVGFNAVVLSGITIANSSVIAAGSVVTKDVPENCIVAGNPAKKVKNRYSGNDFDRHWASLTQQGVRRMEVTQELRFEHFD